jgi:hypothetical protein
MNTPYKMKGDPMGRNFGLPSPAKRMNAEDTYEPIPQDNTVSFGEANTAGGTAGQAAIGNAIASFQNQQTQKSAQMANTPIDYDPHRREI